MELETNLLSIQRKNVSWGLFNRLSDTADAYIETFLYKYALSLRTWRNKLQQCCNDCLMFV